MPAIQKVDKRPATRVFNDFFKIDALEVSHMQNNGVMSEYQRRLVLERGDAVAVLLYNVDTKCIVAVRQFRAPTLGKGSEGGWITEAVAGTIDQYETPERTAVRETMEETGYKIGELKLIAQFFSSPGGSSERVYLYYAKVCNADKIGNEGGINDEDIEVVNIPIDELFKLVRSNTIEDSKLLIGTLYLQEQFNAEARAPLGFSEVMCPLIMSPDLSVGYVTGPIDKVQGFSVWVNSENADMLMDRFNGRSISARIRFLGAAKDRFRSNVIEDTINDELTRAVGRSAPVRIGSVFETSSGNLAVTNGVNKILHVASVHGAGSTLGFQAQIRDLAPCVKNVLTAADQGNHSFWRRVTRQKNDESILIPLIGAGDGGLSIEQVVPNLIGAAIEFLQESPASTIKKISFLAFTGGHKAVLDRELQVYCRRAIIRCGPAAGKDTVVPAAP
jgi:nudix-type nucleoside diphosphatase (YffH/AdpP family)